MKRWYHPAFETDLIEAARYLEQKRHDDGRVFLDEAEAAVELIMQNLSIIHTSRRPDTGLER